METIEFPPQLEHLLKGSPFHAPLRILADRVGEILGRSEPPFFRDYTDHGVEHINRVLESEVELIPREVFEKSRSDSSPRLLCDADAAIIIGATLFHDIAMYIHAKGFQELIAKGTRFEPLPWFRNDRPPHSADRPWCELWGDYLREARKFSDRALANIVGEKAVQKRWKFENLPDNLGSWEVNHHLVVGEFIRRHHARLAHEIAIYGFPGLEAGFAAGQFPALGQDGLALRGLADLIGLTARSHWLSLRICKGYLDSNPLYLGTPRPMNSAVLYSMALLRVADYLQIDQKRAPMVLLHLRNPPSPISVREWRKHEAVQSINSANYPEAKWSP